MAFTLHHEHEKGTEPEVARVEEVDAASADLASDMEVKQLQDTITSMNAAAQRLENEIAQMLAETGGAAASSSECTHAKQAARDMHSAADGAKAALTNAPTDPKTGKKMISSKKVASLSSGMLTFISGAEAEGAKVEAAALETHAHDDAAHAKSTGTVAKVAKAASKCTHAAVCAVVGTRATSHHWFSDGVDEVKGFGARVSHGISSRWNGFTAGVSGFVAGVIHSDPIGTIERVAGDAYSGTVAIAKNVAHSVKEHAVAAVTAVGGVLSSGKAMIGNAIDSINPFKAKAPAAVPHVAHHAPAKPHAPIHVAPSAMEKAMAQAKALVTHSLPHISMPHLSDFIPSSVPSLQGVMGELGHIH